MSSFLAVSHEGCVTEDAVQLAGVAEVRDDVVAVLLQCGCSVVAVL